jgi:hypothetical protein
MRRWTTLLLSPVLGLAAFNAAACYTVYDRSDRVVYQSERPPVDMSRPLHETLPARFPGGHMIFEAGGECAVISSLATGMGGRNLSTTSPLLTDESTARAMRLPHTQLAGGIALVQPRDASMAPGITVVPSSATTFAASRPARDTVITELRSSPASTAEAAERRRAEDSTRMMGAGPAPKR